MVRNSVERQRTIYSISSEQLYASRSVVSRVRNDDHFPSEVCSAMMWQDLIFLAGSGFSIVVLAPTLKDTLATVPYGASIPSSVNQYTTELEEMRGMSREKYLENIIVQRGVERTMMNPIQACIDLASHIRASEGVGPTETSKEEIEAPGGPELSRRRRRRRSRKRWDFETFSPISAAKSTTTSSTTYFTTICTGSNGSSTRSRSGTGAELPPTSEPAAYCGYGFGR